MAKKPLDQRILDAATRTLDRAGVIGPIDFLQAMQFLDPGAVDQWRGGKSELHRTLEPYILCGEEKLQYSLQCFHAWAENNGLEVCEMPYWIATREGKVQLQVTRNLDLELEAYYRRGYRRADLTEAQKKRIEAKVNKVADLVVFQAIRDDVSCVECQAVQKLGEIYFVEQDRSLCLSCADMDHLDFLPSGDVAMTRRAKKHSPLSAIVIRFNRRRKKFERQGLLVTLEAIAKAENDCEADADQRAVNRAKGLVRRCQEDEKLVRDFALAIGSQFPSCPAEEAAKIAHHAALRGSGRVGRSEAGRGVEPEAVTLAVRAWVRHQHTDYDRLLMTGVERMRAREMISEKLEQVVRSWLAG